MHKENNSTINIFSEFIKKYRPDDNLIKPTEEELKRFSNTLPPELLDFWKEYGFGNYGNGIVKVINPADYMENLYDSIGVEDFSKLPILITGFGDIFYYRKLQENVEDVCFLDIHYRDVCLCSYTLIDFFKSYIVDDEVYKELLRKDLFEQAYNIHGTLKSSEIFYFQPALALGGAESIEYIGKGNEKIHQLFLFTLTQ